MVNTICVPFDAFFAGLNGMPLRAVGFPYIRFVRTIGPAVNLHVGGHHEGGIKAHAELANNIDILFGLVLLLESERAALCDHAEVVFQLLLRHAAAIVRNGQGAVLLIDGKLDGKIIAVEARITVGQRMVIELINRIAGVGDQLTERKISLWV